MRYLVTGGAGFIGANFVLRMLRREPALSILNLDALTYAGCLETLAELKDEPRHQFVHGDILDEDIRTREVANWIEYRVRPAMATRRAARPWDRPAALAAD